MREVLLSTSLLILIDIYEHTDHWLIKAMARCLAVKVLLELLGLLVPLVEMA